MNWRMAWKLESRLAGSTELVGTNGKRDPASAPGGRKELISEQLFSKLHTCIMCDRMYTHTPLAWLFWFRHRKLARWGNAQAFVETGRL